MLCYEFHIVTGQRLTVTFDNLLNVHTQRSTLSAGALATLSGLPHNIGTTIVIVIGQRARTLQ